MGRSRIQSSGAKDRSHTIVCFFRRYLLTGTTYARSISNPLGSPVLGSRPISPPEGLGVSRVMLPVFRQQY
jgi:hypothetical protein